MASSKQMLLLAVVAAVACLAPLASATVFMVGDNLGWRAKFNNTHWADGKTFRVGDSLLFMYPKEKHTVVQVGEDDFAACNLQGNWLGVWDSGDDVVTLDKPGKVWFICSKPNHCLNGMKLAIDVVDNNSAPTPLPFPFPEVPGLPAATQQSSLCPFPFPFCGPAPAPESTSSPRKSPFPIPAPATSPLFRFLFPSWSGSAAAPASPEAAPPSAAMRNTVGGAVVAVVAAALAF
ncbi:hypothetical protein BDA96_02G043900 [Sorghum bicolor]|uniref:Phytocyanin domain-containing protein n=1 Tax=Sorghum bicolor TaxID=4558 RepID=A0A921RL43_SORBI|nr:hypothetical protein BDA96_02G043900 [Sorghum bicolor]